MNIVVIGSGIAALSAARVIKRAEPGARLMLVTDEAVPFYYRPLIPLVMNGTRDINDIKLAYDPAKTLGIETVHGVVSALESDAKAVVLADGRRLNYDRLLIASGSKPVMPEIDGIGGEGVFTLRTLDDAVRIRDYSKNITKAAVIGGGFVGVKTAEALAKKGMRVTLLEQMPQILHPRADRTASEIISSRLRQMGIEVVTGTKIRAIAREKNGRVRGVMSGSAEIEAELIIVATGVKANVDFLRGSGVRYDRGVLVDEHLRTSAEGIYAAGDVIQYRETITGENAVGGLWTNAVETGKIAGMNIVGQKATYDSILSVMNAADIGGLAFITVGAVHDKNDGFEVYRQREGETYRKLVFYNDRIVGSLFLGDVSRAGIYTHLIKNRIPIPSIKQAAVSGRLNYSHFVKIGL